MTAQAAAANYGTVALIVAGMLAHVVLFVIIYATRYKKAGPNEALIVSGLKRRAPNTGGRPGVPGFRIVKGGGTFVWPVLERVDTISLETIPVPVSLPGLRASAHVRIGGDPSSILAAAERFLSKKPAEIATIAGDVLERHARRALAAGKPEASAVERQVAEDAGAELAPMGLELASFTVQELRDGHGSG